MSERARALAGLSAMLMLVGASGCTGSHRPDDDRPTGEGVAGMGAPGVDAVPPHSDEPPTVPPTAPVQLRALGGACESVRTQTHCASLTDAGVALIGIDRGEYCVVPIDDMPQVSTPSGLPIALSWRGSTLHACVARPRKLGVLMRFALDARTVERSERDCASVVDWEAGLLVAESSDGELYPDFAAALRAEPSGMVRAYLVPSASHGGSLYGLVDSGPYDHRRLYEFTPGVPTQREIPLAESQPLLGEGRIVSGLDFSDDGRLVLVVEGRGAGIEVYDATTSRRTAFYASDLAEADWVMRSLACEG